VDGGRQIHLKPHDAIVENDTRHAWRNNKAEAGQMPFGLIGARRG